MRTCQWQTLQIANLQARAVLPEIRCFEVGRNKKGSDCSEPLEFNPGGDLRSRAVTRAVSSAQQGLTSVFGMGTGVTLAIRPPGNWKSKLGSRTLARSFDEQLGEVG